MKTSLSHWGYIWSVLSFLAAGALCAGFYMPYWLINGEVCTRQESSDIDCTAVSFGVFRRCGYLEYFSQVQRTSPFCGRYASFENIPSAWWQTATVLVGGGCGISLLVGCLTLPGWCSPNTLSQSVIRGMGVAQLLSALLIVTGCGLYPLGWTNAEVQEACSSRAWAYRTGRCGIGWSFWVVVGNALLLLVCCSLSTRASKPYDWQQLSNGSVVHALPRSRSGERRREAFKNSSKKRYKEVTTITV